MPALKFRKLRAQFRHVVLDRHFIQALARTLLLVSLVYAPWAFGSTHPVTINPLDDALYVCFALHLIGLVRERRLPHYPLVPGACLALLLLQASWMWFNARYLLDDSFWQFVPLVQPFPSLPGSWDQPGSLFTLKTLGAMSVAFLVASDLMVDSIWKLRLWRTMGIAGASIIVYGLIQKGMGPDSVLAMYPRNGDLMTFFGPYRYHANAGAYLNLVWPVLLALFLRCWRRRGAYFQQTLWSCALVLGLAACFVNTSRASAAIAIVLMVVAALSFGSFVREHIGRTSRIRRGLISFFALGFIAVAIYGGITGQLQGRLEAMGQDKGGVNGEGRFLMYGVCLHMIPEAGWFGFGPGTFSSVLPFHTLSLGDKIKGFWVYAHEDYLQTVIEYGYVGTVLWSVFLFGAIGLASIRGRDAYRYTNDQIFYRTTALALTGLALHSLVDFPLQVASIQLYAMMFLAAAWNNSADKRL